MGTRPAVVLLPILGFASGLLGAQPLAPFGFVLSAPIFGALIAAYFVAFERVRSVARVLRFIAASAGAFLVSLLTMWVVHAVGTAFRGLVGHSSESCQIELSGPDVFFGGWAGASFFLVAALFLFGPRIPTGRSVGRTLLWSAMGGVLAVVGWFSGPALGRPLFFVLRACHLDGGETDGDTAARVLALLVTWQTGVALLLALLFPEERAQLAAAPREVPPIGEPANVSSGSAVVRAVLTYWTLAVLATPALLVVLHVPVVLRQGLRIHALKVRSASPAEQAITRRMKALSDAIDSMQALKPEQALVLEDFGACSAEKSFVKDDRADPGVSYPPRIVYRVNYARRQRGASGTHDPIVSAEVDQYPTVEWAQSEAGRVGMPSLILSDRKCLATVAKFGRRMVLDASVRCSTDAGPVTFSWRSGSVLVRIGYYDARVTNVDFLARYLERYPSSP